MGIVVRQSIITSVISYVGVLIGYVNLLYLFPKFLHQDEIGLLRTLQDSAILLTPFATFGLGQGIIRFFPRYSSKEEHANSFIFIMLLLGIVSYCFFLLILFLFQDYIAGFFKNQANEVLQFLDLILWLTLVLVLTALLEQYSRSLLKIAFPNLLREVVLRVFQGVLVSLYFLKVISFNQLIIGSIYIYLVLLIILIIFLIYYGHLRFTFSYKVIKRQHIKDIITFSAISFVGSSAMIIIGKLDSIMIAGMLGLTSNAVYTTAFYMATVIEIPKRAITTSASTLIARSFQKNELEEVKTIYQKTSINQLIIGALILIGLWINIDNLFDLMPNGEKYIDGKYVVLIVGLGKLIDMFFGPSSEIIGLSKHYWFNLVVITFLAGIVVISNYIMIPAFGIDGAAYGSLIALTAYNVIKFVFIFIKLKFQPFTTATIKVIVISCIVIVINFLLPKLNHIIIDIIYRSSVITLVFSSLILATKCSKEVNELFNSVLNRIKIRY